MPLASTTIPEIVPSRRQTLQGATAAALTGLLGASTAAVASPSTKAADRALLAVCTRLQAARADIDAVYAKSFTIADEEAAAPTLDRLFECEFAIEDEVWEAIEAYPGVLSDTAISSLARIAFDRSANDEFRHELCETIVRDIADRAGASA